MATFVCNQCGNSIEINGNSNIVICKYCGAQQMLPMQQPVLPFVHQPGYFGDMQGLSPELLLEKAKGFLETREWASALQSCDQVLRTNPQNAYAYLYKYMALHYFSSEEIISAQIDFLENDQNFSAALWFAADGLKVKLQQYVSDAAYNRGVIALRENRLNDAIQNFCQTGGFKSDSPMYEKCCETIYQAAVSRMSSTNAKDCQAAILLLSQIPNYKDADALRRNYGGFRIPSLIQEGNAALQYMTQTVKKVKKGKIFSRLMFFLGWFVFCALAISHSLVAIFYKDFCCGVAGLCIGGGSFLVMLSHGIGELVLKKREAKRGVSTTGQKVVKFLWYFGYLSVVVSLTFAILAMVDDDMIDHELFFVLLPLFFVIFFAVESGFMLLGFKVRKAYLKKIKEIENSYMGIIPVRPNHKGKLTLKSYLQAQVNYIIFLETEQNQIAQDMANMSFH